MRYYQSARYSISSSVTPNGKIEHGGVEPYSRGAFQCNFSRSFRDHFPRVQVKNLA